VKTFFVSLVLAIAAVLSPAAAQPKPDPANTLVIEVKGGPVVIRLRPDLAPKHVERVKQLAREKFYDGVKFHRVIAGFMAQTGDPTGTGTGKSKYPNLPAEFTQTSFTRGTVGAARSGDPNSANSQFFICFAPAAHLNGQYTVWGQVIEGMEHIDALKKGAPGSGEVANPDVMQKVYILGDVKR
jgi:peptidylprolyl isomerase